MDKNDFSLVSLWEVFDYGNQSFFIPDYQRNYSWEQEQRNDLKEDLMNVIESDNDYNHFTGTLVASKHGKSYDKFKNPILEIVDGQQRLTTFVILMGHLSIAFKQNGEKLKGQELFETFIAEGLESGNTIYKFQPSENQRALFNKLLIEGKRDTVDVRNKVNTKADQNILDAYKEMGDWVKEHGPEAIFNCLANNIGFLFYNPTRDAEIGIMFEVINNRGKPLSQLEKIKNYLIYYAEKNGVTDLKKKVKVAWPTILENLSAVNFTGIDDENGFLRNCWLVFQDSARKRSYHVYEELKAEWPPQDDTNWERIVQFVDFIEDASLTLYKLYSSNYKNNKEEGLWLERIRNHPQFAPIIPLVLAVYEKITDQNDKVEILSLLEKLNFRFYVAGVAKRNDSGQGGLFDLAWHLYNEWGKHFESDPENPVVNTEWLKQRLIWFIYNNASDKKFLRALILEKDDSDDFHDWQGLKFFLANYEEELRNQSKESLSLENILSDRDQLYSNDFYHREHIWSINHYPEGDNEEREFNKRRLGNFVLLKETTNIKVSNKPPQQKVTLYFEDKQNEPNTRMIRELKDWFDKAQNDVGKNWKRKTKKYWINIYQKFFDQREQELVRFALKRWRIDGLPNKITDLRINSFKETNEIWEVIN